MKEQPAFGTETTTGLSGSEVVTQRIVVRHFRCAARIGVTEEERALPQQLGICLESSRS